VYPTQLVSRKSAGARCGPTPDFILVGATNAVLLVIFGILWVTVRKAHCVAEHVKVRSGLSKKLCGSDHLRRWAQGIAEGSVQRGSGPSEYQTACMVSDDVPVIAGLAHMYMQYVSMTWKG